MSKPSTVDLLIKSGRIYTPSGFITASIAVDKEKIVAVGSESNLPKGQQVIDATGKYLIPGLIDTHSHFRDPGFTHKEDCETGSRAAAAGGVTLTVDMPNVYPPTNRVETFNAHIADFKKKAVVDFGHNASARFPEEIPKLAKAGAFGFKIFMLKDIGRSYPHIPEIGVDNDALLLDLFNAVARTGLVCLVHPNNQVLYEHLSQGYMKKGLLDYKAYAESFIAYNAIVFTTAISTCLLLQDATGVKLHLLHTVFRRGWDLIAAAKARGQDVTTEVNPGALFGPYSSWSMIEKLGPYGLGLWVPEDDARVTWQHVVDGVADIIGTDHAPHTKEEKEVGWKEMWKCPGGSPCMQEFLPLFLTEVNKGTMSLQRVVKLCSENVAKRFGVYPRKGALMEGSDADIVILDLKKKHVIKPGYSKCGWTPHDGREVQGMPVRTIVRGTTVMVDGEVMGKPGFGKHIIPYQQNY